jgi:hypothetical protein
MVEYLQGPQRNERYDLYAYHADQCTPECGAILRKSLIVIFGHSDLLIAA